jgi:hypothetical protein
MIFCRNVKFQKKKEVVVGITNIFLTLRRLSVNVTPTEKKQNLHNEIQPIVND